MSSEDKEEKKEELEEIKYDDCYDKKFQCGDKSVLSSLLSEIKKNPGADLLSISMPAYILEKRSFLERLSDLFIHHNLLFTAQTEKSAEKRFLTICRYYISSWYRIPEKGLLKPFNPILGEVFECSWKFSGHQTDYFSEQVSHHPPKTAYYFRNTKKNILLHGVAQPKAAITLTDIINNRASMSFSGPSVLSLTNLKEDYVIEYPNVVVKGLFSGQTEMENGGTSSIKCKATDMTAEFTWTDKRELKGKIKKESKTIYKIEGNYSEDVYILSVNDKFTKKFPFLNVTKIQQAKKSVKPVKEQEKYESRRVWYEVAKYIDELKYEEANKAKSGIEEFQRKIRKSEEYKDWKPKFFDISENYLGGYRYKNFDDSATSVDEKDEKTPKEE